MLWAWDEDENIAQEGDDVFDHCAFAIKESGVVPRDPLYKPSNDESGGRLYLPFGSDEYYDDTHSPDIKDVVIITYKGPDNAANTFYEKENLLTNNVTLDIAVLISDDDPNNNNIDNKSGVNSISWGVTEDGSEPPNPWLPFIDFKNPDNIPTQNGSQVEDEFSENTFHTNILFASTGPNTKLFSSAGNLITTLHSFRKADGAWNVNNELHPDAMDQMWYVVTKARVFSDGQGGSRLDYSIDNHWETLGIVGDRWIWIRATDSKGNETVEKFQVTIVEPPPDDDDDDPPTGGTETESPSHYMLKQPYPNPFNPETRIQYQIPLPSYVRIDVYNLLGQLISNLANSVQKTGFHRSVWPIRVWVKTSKFETVKV